MIHDARTTKILATARQHRADVIGDFIKSHPTYVVLALALGAVVLSIGHDLSSDVKTASSQQAKVTDVGSR
jgi:hypothetical protein